MHWPQTALLHDHLDGSRPLLNILPELARLSGDRYSFDPTKDHHGQIKRWFDNPLRDMPEKFSITTGVMQTPETLRLASRTYVRHRALQGLKYCEATIAPQYHTFKGLTEKEVIQALIEGIKKGENEFPDIEVNLIASVGREVSPEESVRLVEAFAECDRGYVPGIGLVCNEAENPPEKHELMFRRAKELGFKTTCHAGEWCDMPMFFQERHFDLKAWKAYNTQLLRNIYTAVFMLEVDCFRYTHMAV